MSATARLDAVIRGADLSHKISPRDSQTPGDIGLLSRDAIPHAAARQQPGEDDPYQNAPPHIPWTLHASEGFHRASATIRWIIGGGRPTLVGVRKLDGAFGASDVVVVLQQRQHHESDHRRRYRNNQQA